MLMDVLRILIRPTFTSRLVCNCSRANSRAPLSRPTLRHRNPRMFTPRPTSHLVLALLPLLNGVLQPPLARQCRALLLLDRSQTGTAASTSCSRKAKFYPLTASTIVMVSEPLAGPRRLALTRSPAGLSLILLAEVPPAHRRWANPVLILPLTLCLNWETPRPLVMSVLPAAAMVEEDLCLLHMLPHPVLVVLTAARLVPVLVLLLTNVLSLLRPRFAPFVMSNPHPPAPPIPTSDSTPAQVPRLRLASLRVLLRRRRRLLLPRLLLVSVVKSAPL